MAFCSQLNKHSQYEIWNLVHDYMNVTCIRSVLYYDMMLHVKTSGITFYFYFHSDLTTILHLWPLLIWLVPTSLFFSAYILETKWFFVWSFPECTIEALRMWQGTNSLLFLPSLATENSTTLSQRVKHSLYSDVMMLGIAMPKDLCI